MQKKDDEQIVRNFSTIRDRQFGAIALTVFFLIILAVVFKRPDLFGSFSKKEVLTILIVIMLVFINFSSWNWRCPSCRNYLGNDLFRVKCKKCGVRLQK